MCTSNYRINVFKMAVGESGSSVRTQMYFRFSLCLKGDVVSLNVVFSYTFRATSVQPFCFCFCLFLIA